MKYFKHSKRVKWLAILLASIAGTAAFPLLITTIFTYCMGLYQKPLDKALETQYQKVQEYYSADIFNCHISNEELPEIENMEYGILSATESKKINSADLMEYIYYNFGETTASGTSYQTKFFTKYRYQYYSNSLYSILLSSGNRYIQTTPSKIERVIHVVYNKEDGLFYLATKNYYIPLQSFGVAKNHLKPKVQDKKDTLNNIEYFSVSDTYTQEWDKNNYDMNYWHDLLPARSFIIAPYMYDSLTGKCENLSGDYKDWNYLYFDDFMIPTNEIKTVTSDALTDIRFVEAVNIIHDYEVSHYAAKDTSYTESDYPYIYNSGFSNTSEKENVLWIVSNVKETIDTSADDLFAKTYTLLTMLYKYRYVYVILLLLTIVVLIASLWLIYLATDRLEAESQDAISFRYKIPLLLYLAGMGGIITGFFWLFSYTLRTIYHNSSGAILESLEFPLAVMALFASVLFAVFIYCNLVTRRHARILWKYSVTHFLVSMVQKVYDIIQKNTSLFIKGLLAYLLLNFMALCLLLFITDFWLSGRCLFAWLLLTIVTVPVYFYILLQLKQLQNTARQLAEGNFSETVNTRRMLWEFKKHGNYLNRIHDGMQLALREQLKSEHFRTELITNVSHDIKTPLTSIINYIDLLQKEAITETERSEYLEVLERQSARLKKLIEDLMEASKASTGNLPVNLEECDIDILLTQTLGEFEEKLFAGNLELIIKKQADEICIQADSRHLWRIFDNLMNNICKYAQPGTRVYINQEISDNLVKIIFLNTSKYALNISGEELMERFVRGDSSRNTEGSGLGLSIAKSLAELMQGTLDIIVEGDLFKVVLSFPRNA